MEMKPPTNITLFILQKPLTLSHDNTTAQGIDDNAYEHVRKAF